MAIMGPNELKARRLRYEELQDVTDIVNRAARENDGEAVMMFGRQYHELKAALDRIGWSKVNPEVITERDPVS
jgi:hypothetical protein